MHFSKRPFKSIFRLHFQLQVQTNYWRMGYCATQWNLRCNFFSVSLNQSQHETFWNINSEAYLGPCQTNNGFSRSLFFRKTPSQVSDRVLNTSLQNILNLFCKKSSRSHCFWFDGSTVSDVLLVWCTFGLMEVLFQKYCFISFHLI